MRRFVPIALAMAAAAAQAEPLAFTPADIAGWRPHRFSGETRYALDGDGALRATCENAASGLFLERRIDLTRTPVMEWRWRVDQTFPPGPAETIRAGDDYPVRLYVVRRATLPWRTRALNYVWASRQPQGADWPNAYASQAHMIALRSGPGQGWAAERRNLREDFLRFHGETVDHVDAVAIMTDCDDRAATAEAWYGEIRFLAE
jgi:hypothetical protein